MRINRRTGEVVHGVTQYGPLVGGRPVYPLLNGLPVTVRGGEWDWLFDHVIAGPGTLNPDTSVLADYRIYQINLVTRAIAVLDPRGANHFIANGNGVWAANGDTTYFDSTGAPERPNTLAVAISASGQIAAIPFFSNEPRGGDFDGETLVTDQQYVKCARTPRGLWTTRWIEGLGLCLELNHSGQGLIVHNDAHDYYPDVVFMDGRLIVYTSYDAGDITPRVYTFDPSQAIARLPVVRPFRWPVFVGVMDDAALAAPANTPPIGPLYPSWWADWEYGEDHDETDAQICGGATRPRGHYSPPDHRERMLKNLLPGDAILTPAFRRLGEPISEFRARIKADLQVLVPLGHPLEVVAHIGDRDIFTEDEILECFPVWRDLFDVSPLIRGIRFYPWDRRDGPKKHPALIAEVSAFVAASPGVPEWTAPVDPPAPKPPKPPVPPSPPPPPAPPPAPVPKETIVKTFIDPTPIPTLEVTEEAHGDKFALKKTNGKYFGIDSEGKVTEADSAGVDQLADKTDKGYVFTNDFRGHKTNLVQLAQVKK